MEEENEIKSYTFKKQPLIVAGCFLLFILFCISGFIYGPKYINENKLKDSGLMQEKAVEQKKVAEKKDLVARKIDGVLVEKGKENILPVAVMIDNHVDARPQSGLSRANIVYEAEAEGGITRFLAIFASGDKVEEIGPVRSARSYFVDWANEYGAMYVHCGGSPEALEQIVNDELFDMNQFYHGADFWRADGRPAPHNLMTSSDNLYRYVKKKNKKVENYEQLLWKSDAVLATSSKSSKNVKILYSGGLAVSWKYDIINNIYTRYLIGKKQVDKQGWVIEAKNIIIQTISSQVVDEKKRLKMNDIGKGNAIVCNDGKCIKAEWRKISKKNRTKYYFENKEVSFNAGTTWIQVIRPGIPVEY